MGQEWKPESDRKQAHDREHGCHDGPPADSAAGSSAIDRIHVDDWAGFSGELSGGLRAGLGAGPQGGSWSDVSRGFIGGTIGAFGTFGIANALPQLDADVMALRNRAYAAPATRLGNHFTLIWQGSGRFRPAVELACRTGDLPFFVASDSLALLEPRLQGFDFFIPSEACTALVEHALSPVLDLVETLTGQPVACDGFRRIDMAGRRLSTDDEASVRIGFELTGDAGRPRVRGWLRADKTFWPGVDFSRTIAVASTRHESVPLRMSVQLGHCRLTIDEFGRLRRGDALRVTPKPARGPDAIAVRLIDSGSRLGCHARLSGDSLTLLTSMELLMDASPATAPGIASATSTSTSTSASTSTATATATPNIANIPNLANIVECELSFELGSIRMTLAELGRLRVGQGLRLGVHLQDQPVSILASGRPIARGELAAIGDELVVVVTEIGGLPAM